MKRCQPHLGSLLQSSPKKHVVFPSVVTRRSAKPTTSLENPKKHKEFLPFLTRRSAKSTTSLENPKKHKEFLPFLTRRLARPTTSLEVEKEHHSHGPSLTVCSSIVLAMAVMGTAVVTILEGGMAIANPFIQVELERWFEVRTLVGNATILLSSGESSSVQQGDRFGTVGDRIITADESRSVLSVDTSVGFIDVFENTDLQVQELRTTGDGGKVTKLKINQGQARLRVRPFTHDSSDLEIETPAGWSAVRGTEFGVAVHPDGKTGVATSDGQVDAYAQGQSVAVNPGFQTLIIPGEPPTEPTLIDEARATRLTPYVIERENAQNIRFVGNIDPVSLLIIENEPQIVERNGDFDVIISTSNSDPIEAIVVTPLGRQQSYVIALPR